MGQIQYSDKYFDDTFEYRHVVLPPEVANLLPKNCVLSEECSKAVDGFITRFIMLFRRTLNYQQQQENQAQNLVAK
ncbi:unnamed protein product [Thlaspi arvense]|uniref:Cyclin-dependent kinases regulatory subunit n=1 Tax=Thlaspi arvense TaxID=13288 RepID=A0AAU9SAH7_THLAR|nr:unnamed protein product [Thlaspi arvense]